MSQLLCYYVGDHGKMKDFDDGTDGTLKVDLITPISNLALKEIEIN